MTKNIWTTDHVLEVIAEGRTLQVFFQHYNAKNFAHKALGNDVRLHRINVQFSAKDVAEIALKFKKFVKLNKNGRVRISFDPCNSEVEIELERIVSTVFPKIGISVATSKSVDEVWGTTTDDGVMLTFPVDYTYGHEKDFHVRPEFVQDLNTIYYKDYAK